MSYRTARLAPEKADFRPALPLRSLPGLYGADMPTYSELLRDPRWQKKRLEKLEAAEWRCERCCDSESTLAVHHKHYVKGRMPWEYDRGELAVLCETCHEGEHAAKAIRSELVARLEMDGPLSVDDFTAHGAGAVSVHHSMIEPTLQGLLDQVQQGKPLQFACGRLSAALMWFGDGRRWHMRTAEVQRFADLVNDDPAFGSELAALLLRFGVPIKREGDAGA